MLSEKKGLSSVEYSREFLSLKDKSLKDKCMKLQNELFRRRTEELRQKLMVIHEKTNEAKITLAGLEQVGQQAEGQDLVWSDSNSQGMSARFQLFLVFLE